MGRRAAAGDRPVRRRAISKLTSRERDKQAVAAALDRLSALYGEPIVAVDWPDEATDPLRTWDCTVSWSGERVILEHTRVQTFLGHYKVRFRAAQFDLDRPQTLFWMNCLPWGQFVRERRC